MKKHLIIGIFAALALTGRAATPQFTEHVRIDMPKGAHAPVLSPDGATLLFSTTDNHEGLCAMNLNDGQVTLISEGVGAAFNPVFSLDSRTVFFRTATTIDGLLNHDVRSFSLADKTARQLAKPSRRDINLQAEAKLPDYAVSTWKTITVYTSGKLTEISPVADAHSYQWASLSPDGSRLLFTEPFKGVFVAGVDGSNPVKVMSKGDYPTWLDDEWVLAIVSHDDGYGVLDSRLYAVSTITGEKMQLTADDELVGEVTVSAATGRVAYTTMTGELFMFNLK